MATTYKRKPSKAELQAIRNALSYVGPGFELVAFDPKVSISLVGREAWTSQAAVSESSAAAAADVGLYNQGACASR